MSASSSSGLRYAGVLLALAFLAGFSAPRELQPIVQLLFFVVLDGFLLTLGLAILKYRLYAIDLVINKTLVYGALAVLIASVYIAFVVGMGALIGTRGEPNLILALVATAVVAVAFEPLRQRVQRLANQVVYGHRASPYEVLAQFSRRMAEALSVDEVLPRMAEAAARGVGGPARACACSYPAVRIAWWPGQPTATRAHSIGPSWCCTRASRSARSLSPKYAASRCPPAEAALLSDLAAQAGPALSNVRLTLELEARLRELATQADELRASRQRIVAAQDAERRRIERDIHDGAQQHLVAIAVNARLARQVLDSAPMRTGTLLDEISAQVDDALETLRALARGIFPPVLADRGLVPALRAHLTRSGLSARLEADDSVARARFDRRIESALYFCGLEALQNAAKHALGAPVSVRLSAEAAWLTLAVSDDGPGFNTELGHTGTGLQGMFDRMAAVGGTLEVVSVVGEGTTIRGRAPRQAAQDPEVASIAAAQAADSDSEPNAAFAR